MNRYDLSDFEWSVIEPLLPNKPRRRGRCGRRLRAHGNGKEKSRASALAEDVPVGTKDEVRPWPPKPQSVDDGVRASKRLFRLVF